jgi:DNA-binding CsgD family transcriptional regulator
MGSKLATQSPGQTLCLGEINMNDHKNKELKLHQTTAALYEAVTSPNLWAGALDKLYNLFDSATVHYYQKYANKEKFGFYLTSTTFERKEETISHFIHLDPRKGINADLPVGSTYLCTDHFNDDYVEKSEYYQDHLLKAGRRYIMLTKLVGNKESFTALGISRSPKQDPFDTKSLKLLETVRPHLQRVAVMHRQFETVRAEADVNSAVVDQLTCALFTLTGDARLLRANRSAENLLEANSCVRLFHGLLVASEQRYTGALQALITSATRGAAAESGLCGGNMILVDGVGRRYCVIVAPLNRRSDFLGRSELPLALMTISRLDSPASSGRQLITLFGLTVAEARVASEIANGNRLQDIAAARNLSISTLRTQLRAVFAKTETSRQSELVKLLSRIS